MLYFFNKNNRRNLEIYMNEIYKKLLLVKSKLIFVVVLQILIIASK